MKENTHFFSGWINEKRHQRAKRALERQLIHQRVKAQYLVNKEKQVLTRLYLKSSSVLDKLENIQPIPHNAKILEVGSGAHGLMFGLRERFTVGIDPLAVDYKKLFPVWQKNTNTIAAIGEKLPFADSSFDIVLCDNVIDHAENPPVIIEEITRVLKPAGLFYFTVNVHHPIYSVASNIYGFLRALGSRLEISPFADHTVHLNKNRIMNVFQRLPLDVLSETYKLNQGKKENKLLNGQTFEGLIKKVFYKNAAFEVIAKKK